VFDQPDQAPIPDASHPEPEHPEAAPNGALELTPTADADSPPDEAREELPAAQARGDERGDEREVLGNDVEGAVPPGYDWPTHGGYLGCFVASLAACMLAGFLSANLLSFLYIALRWPLTVYALVTVAIFVALLAGLGRLGWVLGKRFYRYYPQPRPTWGESDTATDALQELTAQGGEDAAQGIGQEATPAIQSEKGNTEIGRDALGDQELAREPTRDARAGGTPAVQ
jgi:hypothetical protein